MTWRSGVTRFAAVRRDERVVLLSWPRTGSSSLWRILGTHPRLALMEDEPFNEAFSAWAPGNPDYLARLAGGVQPLLDVLEELFSSYDGIKVLDYQLDDDQLAALVSRPGLRLLYLRRRNLLQTAVSDRIAKQVQVWNRWDVPHGEDLSARYRSLQPLDLDDLRSYVEQLRAHLRRVDALLDPRGAAVHQLCYEDLFLSTPPDQDAVLGSMWTFLGLPPLDRSSLRRHLDHRSARLAAPETYGRLPNAARINEVLGSRETGYLPSFLV